MANHNLLNADNYLKMMVLLLFDSPLPSNLPAMVIQILVEKGTQMMIQPSKYMVIDCISEKVYTWN